jgi:hypothetical protein
VVKNRSAWIDWLAVLALIGLAFWLRWRYIQDISLFVDEFNTIWAAKNVLVRGLPIFPSGNFYQHGMLFTYLEVPFVLGPFNETIARLPGLLVSLLMMPVAYWVGRRMLSPSAGLVVAAALALDPEAITWGGRARMYGLFQLLTVLAVYLWYTGLTQDSARRRLLAMLVLVGAIFCHAEGILLLPAFGLAMLAVWPLRHGFWRRLWRWNVILPWALVMIGSAAVAVINKVGQPGLLETLQPSRPLLEVNANLVSGPLAFAPAFIAWYRLPFTILTVIGLVWEIRLFFVRSNSQDETRASRLFLYIILVVFVSLLFLLAGGDWQRDRYLFVILPLLYLLAGDRMAWLLSLKSRAGRPWCPLARSRWLPVTLAAVTAIWVGFTGTRTAFAQEWGYDVAFRYLQSQIQPDDVVLSPFPAACVLYLDRCDYFAIQRGYEEYVMPKDGQMVDRWTATPLLNTTDELKRLLQSGQTLWLVADGWRFQTRFEPDFILTVLDQFVPVFTGRGVTVFRAEGYRDRPSPSVERERRADFDEELALVGYALSTDRPVPGGAVEVTLYWQALDKPGPEYTAFIHLVNADGTGVAQVDSPLLGGFFQPAFWPKDQDMPDRRVLTLPADLPPGRYRLDAGLYRPGEASEPLPIVGDGDQVTLGFITVGEQTAIPAPATSSGVQFGPEPGIEPGALTLTGYTVHPEGRTVDVDLVWQAAAPVERDYTVFVHLVGSDGQIAAQSDGPPGGSFYPTSFWQPGEPILDEHLLALPEEAPAGDYTVLVGVYYQPTHDRLPNGYPNDALPLGTFALGQGVP